MSRTRFTAVMLAAGLAGAAIGAPAAAQTVNVSLGDTISVDTLAIVVALERAKERGDCAGGARQGAGAIQ